MTRCPAASFGIAKVKVKKAGRRKKLTVALLYFATYKNLLTFFMCYAIIILKSLRGRM